MNFMRFIAEELREIMAKLGIRRVDDLVGRTDLLRARSHRVTDRAEKISLDALLSYLPTAHFRAEDRFSFGLEKSLDERVLLPAMMPHFRKKTKHTVSVEVSSTDRTVGTILGSVITDMFGDTLAEDTYTVECHGGGGQSFGAFIPRGLTLTLTGDANDYFGKGLSGGKLIVKPEGGTDFHPWENIIVGNVALYGATGGEAYIAGIAGERFCVRNSGATAVVEGCGDHGCEYMTGGRVVVLGGTGKNFAAGMSGGVAYVLDSSHDFYLRLNKQMVDMEGVTERHAREELHALIAAHAAATGSERAREILAHFEAYLPAFKRIIPRDYRKMLVLTGKLEERGIPHEEAKMQAFYQLQKG